MIISPLLLEKIWELIKEIEAVIPTKSPFFTGELQPKSQEQVATVTPSKALICPACRRSCGVKNLSLLSELAERSGDGILYRF